MCGCLSGLTKYILFIFNLLIVVCAILFIVFGAFAIKNADKGLDDTSSRPLGIFAIAVGVIIFFIAFFGCCGAIKENSCLLSTYAGILIALFILQLVLGIIAFVAISDKDSLTDDVKDSAKKLFEQYSIDSDKRETIDDLQQSLECCGVNGPSYWGKIIPQSCCEDNSTICTINNAYQDNCVDAFTDAIISLGKVLGGIAIGFGIVELVGAVFACIVRNRK